MDYAERMRNLRVDKDWNQTQIAIMLRVGQKTYSDYELRKTRIPVDSLMILAKLYDVDMNYICGISNEKRPYPKKQS